ncbi:uncharacterized protein LOC106170392 isoform X1 [Lingula anatina]|uniref:Uncharacterized protein LOC106170392 isoform X1 n=1 Tax=Lingula anatina TaxID=7574 RepID=A0A1S3J777_LINAN|nr:uncharacterized protein LOC106170392 isoform X1 [Lingula anatina]|eukprot:XP_013405694.1 uncharacterized protein LOC106170392 isoform X1 [Lingula anatina]
MPQEERLIQCWYGEAWCETDARYANHHDCHTYYLCTDGETGTVELLNCKNFGLFDFDEGKCKKPSEGDAVKCASFFSCLRRRLTATTAITTETTTVTTESTVSASAKTLPTATLEPIATAKTETYGNASRHDTKLSNPPPDVAVTAGIVAVSGLVVLAAVGILICFLYKKKQKWRMKSEKSAHNHDRRNDMDFPIYLDPETTHISSPTCHPSAYENLAFSADKDRRPKNPDARDFYTSLDDHSSEKLQIHDTDVGFCKSAQHGPANKPDENMSESNRSGVPKIPKVAELLLAKQALRNVQGPSDSATDDKDSSLKSPTLTNPTKTKVNELTIRTTVSPNALAPPSKPPRAIQEEDDINDSRSVASYLVPRQCLSGLPTSDDDGCYRSSSYIYATVTKTYQKDPTPHNHCANSAETHEQIPTVPDKRTDGYPRDLQNEQPVDDNISEIENYVNFDRVLLMRTKNNENTDNIKFHNPDFQHAVTSDNHDVAIHRERRFSNDSENISESSIYYYPEKQLSRSPSLLTDNEIYYSSVCQDYNTADEITSRRNYVPPYLVTKLNCEDNDVKNPPTVFTVKTPTDHVDSETVYYSPVCEDDNYEEERMSVQNDTGEQNKEPFYYDHEPEENAYAELDDVQRANEPDGYSSVSDVTGKV